jgi:hypothetical protein
MYGEMRVSNPGCVPGCSDWLLVVFLSLLLSEGIVFGHDCLFTCVYLLSTEDHLAVQFDALQQYDYPGLNNVMRNNPTSFMGNEE